MKDHPEQDDSPKREAEPPMVASPSDPSTSKPLLNRAVQAQIGQRLRVFYESLALGEQPVPDRFIEIIDRLDKVHPEKPQ